MAAESLKALATARLRLVQATGETIRAELEDLGRFAALLGVARPQAWPPPLNDEASQRWMLDYVSQHEGSRWGLFYVVAEGQVVGNIGFKGPPAPDGTVEIGYAILEAYQRRGYASEAARRLIEHAFEAPEVQRIVANTFPELVGSIGVLKRCGFRHAGPGTDEPGSILFELKR